MDSRLLNHFVVAAEMGNLTAAARRLNVTQSALSRQIQKLEEQLGVTLLDRNGRRVRISAEGEALRARMNEVLTASRQLQDSANDLRKEANGTLRVGACSQLVERYFPAILGRWREMAPKVDIRVEEGGGLDLNARMLDGDLHLAINASSYAMVDAVEQVKVGRLQINAVGTAAVLGRPGEPIDIGDLCTRPVLALNTRHASRQMFDAACRLGGHNPVIALESASTHTLLWMAASGLGAAIIPAVPRQEAGAVVVRPVTFKGEPLAFDISAMWSRRYPLPSYGRRFVSLLADFILAQEEVAARADNVVPLPRAIPRAR